MKVALYVRVSTDRQAETSFSLAAQADEMRKWCDGQGHQVVEVFEDPGETATDDKRPEFRRLMDHALSPDHPFDAIVIWTLSRFMREAHVFEHWYRRLKRAKVTIISVTQPTTDDEVGNLIRRFMNLFDEYSSKENAKNVKRQMCDNAARGFFNGSKAPFGYVAVETEVKGRTGFKRKLELKAEEAEIVRQIYKLASEGKDGQVLGYKKIASHLNQSGLLRRGTPWRLQKIHEVLHDEVYAGTFYYNRSDSRTGEIRPKEEWVGCAVPAVVTKEQFDAVAQMLEARAPHHHESKAPQSLSLLTGIAKCGLCGKGLVLATGKSGAYEYYRCATRMYEGNDLCTCPNLPKGKLDSAVVAALADELLTPERVQSLITELRTRLAERDGPIRVEEMQHLRRATLASEKLNQWHELLENVRIPTERDRGFRRMMTVESDDVDR